MASLRILLVFCALVFVADAQPASRRESRRGPGEGGRIAASRAQKDSVLRRLYREASVTRANARVFLRVFKQEQEIEVWASDGGPSSLLKSYRICAESGTAGPKNRENDMQIPEGFYTIDLFNPWSSYYLSMRVNYPNSVDRARNRGERRLGGDIYIHGMCVSIGCVSVSTDDIQEIFLLCYDARRDGQASIPVHFFPARFDAPAYLALREQWKHDATLLRFWDELEVGYRMFERTKKVPTPATNREGRYVFAQ